MASTPPDSDDRFAPRHERWDASPDRWRSAPRTREPEPAAKERAQLLARLVSVRRAREALRGNDILPHGPAQRARAMLLFVGGAVALVGFVFWVFS